ncbi:Octaprenyl diphosphate synthase / Dimethylallyltransferase / (2E,6E)-farnesyl diphosphate synthase / Geranylgeranyl pyrophosphate synthetase [Olavius algarvensis spirochete endosymbiont]|nr:Octaprenyl diphosphate synthase / Dimethylallyltransferase / (2E,6E)-farnesyl diphosphate synthase / Geranylgeranyl pyrophosphate synthetase [Olavius algarvensis spirochete endosymbiont]
MRHHCAYLLVCENAVSIHAPARGATPLLYVKSCYPLGFNPRTREGCDVISTAPRRLDDSFNPRTREGCDEGRRIFCDGPVVSIHAPARGATS